MTFDLDICLAGSASRHLSHFVGQRQSLRWQVQKNSQKEIFRAVDLPKQTTVE